MAAAETAESEVHPRPEDKTAVLPAGMLFFELQAVAGQEFHFIFLSFGQNNGISDTGGMHMSKKLTAAFDSVDDADRAMAKLRRIAADYEVEIAGEPLGSTPADSPFIASVYYPYRADSVENSVMGMPYSLGGRVLLTSEIMGLPICRDTPTEVELTLEDADAARARALLINQGAHRTRLT